MRTRICWWLVRTAARLLDEPERDVVHGDLVECNVGPGRALGQVIGLVLRRQAALWFDWRPWLTVLSVVIPIGLLLSHVSRWWGETTALNVARYWTLWDFRYLGYPGWRADLVRYAVISGMGFLALIGWSWTSGFVLARLSRQTLWLTATMLFVIVFAGTLGTLTTAHSHTAMAGRQHFIVFIAFPRLVRACLVMLPAVWGAYRGARGPSLPLVPTTVGVLLLVSATALYSHGLEGSIVFGRGAIPADAGPDGFVVSADDPRPLWFLSLVVIWPAAYVLAAAALERWRERAIAAR
jgi:hypothetical protein